MWTEVFDWIPDDELVEGIVGNGRGDSPDNEEALVRLQPAIKPIF